MDEKLDLESQKARDLLRDAIESLTEGFALYGEDRRLVMFNKRYAEMNALVGDLLKPGLPYELMLREMARRGGYSDAIGREKEWIAERLDNSFEFAQDDEIRHTNGKTYLVSIHPTSLGGFVVTRNDITERKKAEAVERDGDLLVRNVLEASPAAVVMAHMGTGEIVYRSPAAIELLGKARNTGEYYFSAAEGADFITALLADEQINDHRATLVNRHREPFPAALFSRIAEHKGEVVAVTTIIDLTKQREAEDLLRQVLNACPTPLQMTNAETGELLFRSPATVALFGETDSSRTYYAESGARDAYLKELRRNGFVENKRLELINASGQRFWGAVSSRLIDFKGQDVIVSNTRDLTNELAIAEELKNQRELVFQNEKMSALGELLAGVAHELNNPLSVVVGHSMMMREEVNDPDLIRRIEKISTAAERCAKIVKTFLAMARQQPAKMEKTELESVVATAVDVANYGHLAEGLTVRLVGRGNLPDVVADVDQITQVVINLILNAAQAIADSGEGDTIEVATSVSDDDTFIQLIVSDNGPGIPQNLRPRIFEPFFTTKEVGSGTGIGLSLCHRIILSHGGQIWLDQDHFPGTRFCIRLPVAQSETTVRETGSATHAPKRQVRVLVVDDEADVGEMIAEILKKTGLDVELVHSGSEAINLLKQRPYDVILSDINMPQVDGRGIFDALVSDFPDLVERCAFITGDTMGQASQQLLADSQRPHLEKPITPRDLLNLVHDLLDPKPDG